MNTYRWEESEIDEGVKSDDATEKAGKKRAKQSTTFPLSSHRHPIPSPSHQPTIRPSISSTFHLSKPLFQMRCHSFQPYSSIFFLRWGPKTLGDDVDCWFLSHVPCSLDGNGSLFAKAAFGLFVFPFFSFHLQYKLAFQDDLVYPIMNPTRRQHDQSR